MSHSNPTTPTTPKNGFAVASLALGVTGMFFSVLPIVGVIAWPLVILGLTLGIYSLVRIARGAPDNKALTIAGILTSALGLVVCFAWLFGFAAAVADNDGLAAPGAPAAEPLPGAPVPNLDEQPAEAALGDTRTWESGLAITLSKPTSYTPSSSASGAETPRAVVIDVTVRNGSDTKVELGNLMLTASFNGQPITMIFDSVKGIEGQPYTTVLPGKTAKFKLAYPVEKNPGELQIEVQPDYSADRSYFIGQA